MIWNSRGTGSKSFPSLIREMKSYHKLDFLAIVETRADMLQSERRIKSLGFHEFSFTAAEGFSGGIWCLWDVSIAKVEVLEKHHQFIHLKIMNSQRECWFLTVIYASPSQVKRRTLWSEMYRIKEATSGPWLLGGDFNATLLDQERKSTAVVKLGADREFCRWFEEMNLMDLGFEGPVYAPGGIEA